MKPNLPKGTRDFLPEQVVRRNYIFNTIQSIFELHGYLPIETPTMESLSTLTGKYGEEGDQLLFKILNNGDFLAKADEESLKTKNSAKLVNTIARRGLRYDLTVPFARFVVMHQNEIQFPFKRYAIMPVWRADRPQKGRYQEFYQCDVDVIGTKSLVCEAELIRICDKVFTELDIKVQIKINHRKILYGIIDQAGLSNSFMQVTILIDKIDKIGKDRVKAQMVELGWDVKGIETLFSLLEINDLEELAVRLEENEEGTTGVNEIRETLSFLSGLELKNDIKLDFSLARGLSYYTGCILEAVCQDVKMGSVCGGGRYDDLTSNFGLKGVSGVGISFGAERIYDVMEELNMFEKLQLNQVKILFLTFDESSKAYAFTWIDALRKHGIAADLYPDNAKLKKQMKYASNRGVPYVAVIGDSEVESNTFTLKDMESGHQQTVDFNGMVNVLSSI